MILTWSSAPTVVRKYEKDFFMKREIIGWDMDKNLYFGPRNHFQSEMIWIQKVLHKT